MCIKTYARAARSLFRLSDFRLANGFRIVSYEAIGVISVRTPSDVTAIKLKRIYDRVKTTGKTLTIG